MYKTAVMRIFGPKWEKVARGWRRMHSDELRNLYAAPNIIKVTKSRRMRWERPVVRTGEMINAYNVLVGKPEGIKPLGITKRRWEDNIRMDLRKIGWEFVDWIHLDQDRAGSFEHGNKTSGSIKGGEFLD
jgi:hypothetical protein